MTENHEKAGQDLLDTPHLADALESEQFRHFLDQMPIAIVVSDLRGRERIVYANPELAKLSGQTAAELEGRRLRSNRAPGHGTRVRIVFARAAAVAEARD